jgi:hypothetical protein
MASSHSPDCLVVAFDDGHAVANAGLLLPATLAERDCCPRRWMTFGTTIRIARVHYPCCLRRRAGDLRFLSTVRDRW